MSETMKAMFGVDGCKNGWFYFSLTPGPDASLVYDFGVVTELGDLLEQSTARSRILVDMPMGLLDRANKGGPPRDRGCDALARGLLGPRASSVFPAPVRSVLEAKNFLQANALERAATGLGLSQQTFNIVPKIREVDALMRRSPAARRRVREAHPELCFRMFKGKPLEHAKKTEEGFRERMTVLSGLWPEAESAIARAYLWTPRRSVARDDVVDALVLALAAGLPGVRRRTLPPRPRRDRHGLPMQMVYGLAPGP